MSNAKKVDEVLGELEYNVLWFRKESIDFVMFQR